MSNNLVPYQAISQNPAMVLQFVEMMGDAFHKGGIYGINTLGQGRVLALSCLCMGMDPMEFIATYDIIEGRPSMKADAMLAKFIERGGTHRILSRTPERAEIELSIRGDAQRFVFTMEEATQESYPYKKDGKTWKDNWSTPRKRMQMLWKRVISDGVRTMEPGVNCGVYTPEETADFLETDAPPASGRSRTRKAAASFVEEKVPAADEADFEVVSDAVPPFGEPEASEADATSPATQDAAPTESHAVIGENGSVTPSNPEAADPSVINEIRDLAASDPTLKGIAESALGAYKAKSVRALNRQQSLQMLAVLLTHLAGEKDRLPAALKKLGCDTILDLDVTKAEQMIGFLRKRIAALEPAGSAAGN